MIEKIDCAVMRVLRSSRLNCVFRNRAIMNTMIPIVLGLLMVVQISQMDNLSITSPTPIHDKTSAPSVTLLVDGGSTITTVAPEVVSLVDDGPSLTTSTIDASSFITTETPKISPEPSVPSLPTINNTNPAELKRYFVDKLSHQIGDILKHFQNPEPIGFPGQTVLDDPLAIPNTTTSLGGFVTGNFFDVKVYGLSNFTVEAMNTVLDQLEVYAMLKMKELLIIGNCTLDTIIGLKTGGSFNITLTNVTAEGFVFLTVDANGYLVANKSVSYMTYDDLMVNTSTGGMLQTALSGASSAILAAMKPYILSQIDERITREVNTLLKDIPKVPFSADMSPVDLAIFEGRKFVSEHYEPFEIKKIFEHDSEFLAVSVGPVQIRGLSKFARVGKVTIKMVNSTIQIGLRMITSRLYGRCHFFYDFGKVKAERNGTADFTVEHLQFEVRIDQSVDLRKQPILDDFQLEIGKVAVRLDGGGKLDYLVELGMQFLPQMLRYVIIDALEQPIKEKIQTEILDKLKLDQLIQDNLPLLESIFLSAF